MISRRSLLALISTLGFPIRSLSAQGTTRAIDLFPEGFVWGAAASAPQTESTIGRGVSIWDEFATQPGRIKDGSACGRGTEWDLRYQQDLDLLAQAGLKAFRFSLAWPRVQPDGHGVINTAGLDLYDRMIDAMLARGIEPWPTLFHWDLPAALPGGWLNRDTAYRFADYCTIVGRRLKDRIRHLVVLNEPSVVSVLGHALGKHAPGLTSMQAFIASMHHQNLAQGLGFQALRSVCPSSTRLGTTLTLQPVRPADSSPDSAEAARIWDDAWNLAFLNPLFGKPYPHRFMAKLAPLIQSQDMAILAARPDFLGVNYYSRSYMRSSSHNVLGATWGASPAGTPSTGMGWPVEPDGLVDMLARLRDECGNPEIYITENGASYPDPTPVEGIIADPQRIAFLHDHLMAAHKAIRLGCNLKGYFGWTLTDNWEWAEGYEPLFGLVHVDRTTLQRTPKASLFWLGQCARTNRVI